MSIEQPFQSTPRNNKKEEFTVAIGRDPSILINGEPDLVITTNELEGLEGYEAISLAALLHERGLSVEEDVRKLMPLYDTNFLALLFFDPQNDKEFHEKKQLEHKYSHIPEAWLAQAASIQERVYSLIRERAGDRKVVLNMYHSAYHMPKKWKEEGGFQIQSPDASIAYEYASKVGARNLALQTKLDSGESIPVREGELVDAGQVESTIKKLGGDAFVASDDDPFFSHNLRVDLNHAALPKLREGVKYLVTRWYAEEDGKQYSPNTQVIIGDTRIEYLGQADQIIKDDVRYSGNIFPPDSPLDAQEKMRQYSVALAKEMQAKGYRGFVGFDWIEARSGPEEGRVWLAEINPRKNRSSGMLAAILNHVHKHTTISDMERAATSGAVMESLNPKAEFGQFAQMETYHPSRPVYVPPGAKERLIAAGVSFEEKPDPEGGERLCLLNFPKAETHIFPKESANVIRFTSYGRTREEASEGIKKLRALVESVLVPLDGPKER